MIRFVHTADLHFGVENYGHTDPVTGIHTRLLDFKKAFDACVTHAINEQVDFFLFCGDAYKTAFPTPTQQRLLLDSFLTLFSAKIPVIIIVGNHDNPASFGKVHALDLFAQLPVHGFHVVEKPRTVRLITKNGPINIVGIPWPNRTQLALNSNDAYQSRDLAQAISTRVSKIIEVLSQKLDPREPAILAGHLTVSNGLFSGSEKRAVIGNDPIFLPSQLALSPFSYVALGHLHRHQAIKTGSVDIVYPGSIERIDFGEKNDKKGFCVVSIENETTSSLKATWEFVPLATRKFIELHVTLTNHEDQTTQILQSLAREMISDAVLKIVYHLPAGVQDRVNLKIITVACNAAHELASITPVRQLPPRTQRTQITTSFSVTDALKSYCKSKEIPEEQYVRLIRLLEQIESQTNESTMPHTVPIPQTHRSTRPSPDHGLRDD